MIVHQYYSHMHLCNLIRNAKKNRPFPGSSKGQVSASVFEDHRLRRTGRGLIKDEAKLVGGVCNKIPLSINNLKQ